MVKYVLVLATTHGGDLLTAVFTSKSHGLTESPACSLGAPRAGFFVGVLGNPLQIPTWVDFSSIEELDFDNMATHVVANRKRLLPLKIAPDVFCGVLRCAFQCEDITQRQARLIGDTVATLGCP